MRKLLIRHSLSEANNRDNIGTLAFANKEAPLMAEGIPMARQLGKDLKTIYGINPSNTPVAISELKRTKQTAKEAGFCNISVNSALNEVEHEMELGPLRIMLDRGQLPIAALMAAENLLDNQPAETIWITHGLVIAGLCRVLEIYQKEWLIPRFCEIREINIP